jgi:transcriptional regulator with XRE-family HTH domain
MSPSPTTKAPTPLRLAIARSGRTQREIAAEADLREARLSQIVNGHWNPDSETRTTLANVLGEPVETLFPERQAAA